MKVIINRLRWLSAGVYLTLMFIGWVNSNPKDEKKSNPYTPSDKFNNIYNHYKEKETANA
jgi:hypothetical protein